MSILFRRLLSQLEECSQLFIRARNETLSVVAMCVCNPDRSPVGIRCGNTAATPAGFAELVRYDFPILQLFKTTCGAGLLASSCALTFWICSACSFIGCDETCYRRFQLLSLFVFFEKLIEQHRVHIRHEHLGVHLRLSTSSYHSWLTTTNHGLGRGCGVGRGLGVGVDLGVVVGVAVDVAVGVTVAVAVGVTVGVGVEVAVGVGVGVPPPPQSQLPALTITFPQSPLWVASDPT